VANEFIYEPFVARQVGVGSPMEPFARALTIAGGLWVSSQVFK